MYLLKKTGLSVKRHLVKCKFPLFKETVKHKRRVEFKACTLV